MVVLKDPWMSPPPNVAYDEGEVHVWLASLEQELRVARALYGTLSSDEQQRADRFRFAKDREHFVVARGVLRDIRWRACQCFRSFHTTEQTLEGIESMHMMEKSQVKRLNGIDVEGQAQFVKSLFGVAA
jgi:hypothetical protein